MSPDLRDLFVVSLVAGAPVALTLIVAVLRGYTIDLHMTRHQKRKDPDQ